MKNWNVSQADHALLLKIAGRAHPIVGVPNGEDFHTTYMDFTACHLNGCPLQLKALLDAPDTDFNHDAAGIRRHINRRTGQLEDCFWPRYAKEQ